MLKIWCFACCFIAMVSCSGEQDTGRDVSATDTIAQPPGGDEFADIKSVVITRENEEKVGFHIDNSTQLSEEERRLYRSAALRASMEAVKTNDTTMPLTGKTVGQVITEEREYQLHHGETGTELLDKLDSTGTGKKKKAEDSEIYVPPVMPNQPAGWMLK